MRDQRRGQGILQHSITVHIIIALGIIIGLVLTAYSTNYPANDPLNGLFSNIGSGLIATAFIGLILDLVWIKERIKLEQNELEPIYRDLHNVTDKLDTFTKQLEKLEGRLEAFKQLGFNNCYALRSSAQENFLDYANELIESHGSQSVINIVSSSARGLVGYLDRDATEVQSKWRELISENPTSFRMLLTHPAFAHLRQPAEERSSGDIELEILKTAIYFHCVSGMKKSELRFYRGSPTVFTIQAGNHILLNPYPYGKMAMDTLCLEFESNNETSYVSKFANMHFNHTWAFINQPSKRVDGKALVAGIDSFEDILDAFCECTFLGKPSTLRLTETQVQELDKFTCETLNEILCDGNNTNERKLAIDPPCPAPFYSEAKFRELKFSNEECDYSIRNDNAIETMRKPDLVEDNEGPDTTTE